MPVPPQVFEKADAAGVAALLTSLPHGVLAMSPDIPGLVQTSTNLAVVSTADGEVTIETSQRSDVASAKQAAVGHGGHHLQDGGLRGFAFRRLSRLEARAAERYRAHRQAVHEEILGVKPELIAMHAGLECGVIGEKHPGMQMISFGPTSSTCTAPASVSRSPTVEPFWKYLTGLLARL